MTYVLMCYDVCLVRCLENLEFPLEGIILFEYLFRDWVGGWVLYLFRDWVGGWVYLEIGWWGGGVYVSCLENLVRVAH